MKYFLTSTICAVAAAVVTLAQPVEAAPFKTTFSGTVDLDNGGTNPFGLSNGDAVSGMAFWDNSVLVGSGSEAISVDGNTGFDFSITLGSFTFGQSDVTEAAFTNFFFEDGVFDGIEFYIEPIDIGLFSNLQIEDFDGGRSIFVEDATTGSPVYLELDWNFADATTVAVTAPPEVIPLPAGALLLVSGLGALAVARRRQKTT